MTTRQRLLTGGLLVVALGLIAFGITQLPPFFAHPLAPQICRATYHTAAQIRDCLSYNLWSGVGSDVSEIAIVFSAIGFGLAWWHKHNCHVYGCLGLQWHESDAHGGHPVCKFHHEHHPKVRRWWSLKRGQNTHCVLAHGLHVAPGAANTTEEE